MTFDVSDPEHLRDLANNLAEYSAVHVLCVPVGSESPQVRSVNPRGIRSVANRVEEKAKHDKVIEDVASVIAFFRTGTPTVIAADLLDRFDITPKAVGG